MLEDRARGDQKKQNCKKAFSLTEQFLPVVNTQNATVVLMQSGGGEKITGDLSPVAGAFFLGHLKR